MALAQEPQFVLLQAGNINFANPVFIYEHDNMHLARPIEKAANANDRNFKNGKRGRQVSISPPNRLPNDGSPTPDKKQSLRKKIRRIEIYEDDLANGKALGSTQVEMIKKKEDIRNRLEALKENGSGVMDKEYGNEAHLNDHLYRPSFSSGGCGQLNIHSGPLKVTTFNEFTQKLIECCEEEKIAIDNSMEARATALHKYELQVANYRELMKMALRGVDISSDPFLDETAITQALAAAAYYYSQANIAACNYYHAASAFGTGLSQNSAYGGAHHAATKIDVASKIMAATDDAATKIMAAPKFKAAAKIDAATEAYRRDLLDGSVPDVKTFSKVIAPPKKFDKIIAPPKKIDKIIAPPKKLDQVITPPKRVPKDITNLPKEVVSRKADMPFMGKYRAPVVSYYF